MAGADTIIRLIGGTVALVFTAWAAAVGYMLSEPIYNNVIDPELMESLGWGTPQDPLMLFMGLAFIGISMVVIVWWIVAPARSDVRQNTGGPPI